MIYSPDEPSGEDFTEEAAAEDLSRVGDDDLESSIPSMQRRIDALQAELALRIAEYDRRGLADARHALRTTQWLAHTLRVAKSHASALLRMGRTLEDMPHTAALAATGAITASATRKLAAARNRHPEAFQLHEGVLAEAATHLTPADLRRAINHWEQQVAYPDAVAEVRNRRRRRRLSVSQTWDGMWAVTGELDPESGAIVSTCLVSHVDASRLDDADERTTHQRMADALVEVCDRDLTSHAHSTSGGVKPHVTVTVDFDRLARHLTGGPGAHGLLADGSSQWGSRSEVPRPTLPASGSRLPEIDGLPVEPETVRRLACDASVLPMVLGSAGEILDVGRATRVIPSGMRRALDARDRGCTWTGCDAPASWCDAHHRSHWADGGPTSLENLRLLCRRHHTAVHDPPGAASRRGPPVAPP
jgi:hypothetical protein